jgi:hypothetical protein
VTGIDCLDGLGCFGINWDGLDEEEEDDDDDDAKEDEEGRVQGRIHYIA